MNATRPNAIETSLYWQRYVFRNAVNPAQRERARAAIAKLEAELAAIRKAETVNIMRTVE